MGKALYRQFRPSSFDDVIGQDHITTTLKNSIANDAIGHAYLLTGPRGVGKTSIARILAFAANDIPYQKDSIHLDIIEIDAASNRRIDEIRSLREKVHVAPTSGKYKVYIIDEVHMLTREAFNALLKTLEEPPAHVIFILATTEIHKLPDTIVSRCISFTLRPINQESIVKHLRHIAESEGFKITEEALQLLATHGEGSFRDSISLLDQVKDTTQEVTLADIELALGLAPSTIIQDIINATQQGNPQSLSTCLEQAYTYGATETNIAKQLGAEIRTALLQRTPLFSSDDSLELLANLLTIASSPKPRAKLELCLLDQLFKAKPIDPPLAQVTSPPKAPEPVPPKPVPQPILPKPAPSPEPILPAPSSTPETSAPVTVTDDQLWHEVLQKLKVQNNTLYGIARMAEATHNNSILTLGFKFPFHYKQVSQAKNKAILINILDGLGHPGIEIAINQLSAKTTEPVPTVDPLSTITNIFGDGEVLES